MYESDERHSSVKTLKTKGDNNGWNRTKNKSKNIFLKKSQNDDNQMRVPIYQGPERGISF